MEQIEQGTSGDEARRGTVVVTEATGITGRPLTRRLLERGCKVIVFSRDPDRARGIVPGAAEYVAWQPDEVGAWAAHLDGAAGVIHMGAPPLFEGRVSRAQFHLAERAREESTRNLVRAMAQAQIKPRVFVSGSAVGAYGMSVEATAW